MRKRILLLGEVGGLNHMLLQGLKENKIKANYVTFTSYKYTDRKYTLNIITFILKNVNKKILRWLNFGFLLNFFYSHVVCVYGGREFLIIGKSKEKTTKIFNRLFGKKTKKIFIFNGSDGRPPVLDGIYINTLSKQSSDPLLYLKEHSEVTSNLIALVEEVADTTIAQPHHNANITTPFINACIISQGFKELYNLTSNSLKHHNSEKIIIQHSPSNRNAKGSDIILEVTNEIKNEGFNIEYREIHNKTHREVCENLNDAHIFIDQIYSDIPLTSSALEGAFYNCFTIMGGYQIEETLNTIPLEFRPNFYYIKPDKSELKSILIKAITEHNFRKAEAEKQTKFVQTYCTPKNVAERFLKAISGEAPESWYIKTEEPVIYSGCVIAKGQMISNLKNFISRFGIEATKIKNY